MVLPTLHMARSRMQLSSPRQDRLDWQHNTKHSKKEAVLLKLWGSQDFGNPVSCSEIQKAMRASLLSSKRGRQAELKRSATSGYIFLLSLWIRSYIATRYAVRKGNKAEYLIGLQKELGESWTKSISFQAVHHLIRWPSFISIEIRIVIHFKNCMKPILEFYLQQNLQTATLLELLVSAMTQIYQNHWNTKNGWNRMSQFWLRLMTFATDYLFLSGKNFIGGSVNTTAFLNFIAKSWINSAPSLPQGVTLLLGALLKDPRETFAVSFNSIVDDPELSCRQNEEADTRMLRHLLDAVQQYIMQQTQMSSLWYSTMLCVCQNSRSYGFTKPKHLFLFMK